MKVRLQHALLFAMTALLVACGNPNLTRGNYNLIDVGMRHSEVAQILGEADWCDDLRRPSECRWGDNERHIEVIFAAGRVVDKRQTGLGQAR